jgi:hypothetical protein
MSASLFSIVRLGLIQHSETNKDEALAALSNLYLLMGGLTSYAIAPPSNEATKRARDNAVVRAKEAMGLVETDG